MADVGVEIRLLGDPQVIRGGAALMLPASKKTRALMCYLIGTGISHRREHLCDMFWDGPSDPRAELRWSLTKLRSALHDAGLRIEADRERIGIDLTGASVDLHVLRVLTGESVAAAFTEQLRTALNLFRGEFLDGLELPDAYRFHHWCLAEREAVSRLHLAVVRALIERLQDKPEEALLHARALIAADPLSEDGHAAVIRLLGQLGRKREALAWYEHAYRLLQTEIGLARVTALDQARRQLGQAPSSSLRTDPPAIPLASHSASAGAPLVGRKVEREIIEETSLSLHQGRAGPALHLTGEPGVGKSRLLDHLAERAAAMGCQVWYGRAFEAEATRPYGIWADALRDLPVGQVPETLRTNLTPVRPDLAADTSGPADHPKLLEAAVALLRHCAAIRPVLLICDDIHWLDPASAELLHYVSRSIGSAPVRFAFASRAGELDDNLAASQLVRFLRQTNRLITLDLEPLDQTDTQALVAALAPEADAEAVFTESDGNPLLVLTLLRATKARATGASPRSLAALISGEMSRLPEPAQSLLRWAATLGQRFDLSLLAAVSELPPGQLTSLLDTIERRRIIRPDGEDVCIFTHDLVRQTVYSKISYPSRRLLHRQVARVLASRVESAPEVTGDLARHAALCGDNRLAMRACQIGGSWCLRLFANAEAAHFATLGLAHLHQLSEPDRPADTWIDLLWIKVLAAARPGARPPAILEGEVLRATAAAEVAGQQAAAADGYNLMAFLNEGAGAADRAGRSSLRAAVTGQAMDARTRARQMARSARCLLELELEIAQARTLLSEASTMAGNQTGGYYELQLGLGLLARWDGDHATAVHHMERALTLIRAEGHRWREYRCLLGLTLTSFASRQWDAVISLGGAMAETVGKLGDLSCPFASTLGILAELAQGGSNGSLDRLDAALAELAQADDKGDLAFALNAAAYHHLLRGDAAAARSYAGRALEAGRAIRRRSEVAIARAILARLGVHTASARADATFSRLHYLASDPDRLSARAAAIIEELAARAISMPAPTPVPTEVDCNQPQKVERTGPCQVSLWSAASPPP